MRIWMLLFVLAAGCTTTSPQGSRDSDDKCVIVPRPPTGTPRLTLTVGDSTSDTQNFELVPEDVDDLEVRGPTATSSLVSGQPYRLRLVETGSNVTATIRLDGTTIFTDTLTGTAHGRETARPMPHVYQERTEDLVEFDFAEYRYSLTFVVTD